MRLPRPFLCQASATTIAGSASLGSRTDPARHANTLAAGDIERDQRLVIMMIDVGQVVELRVAQLRDRSEEAPPARSDAESLEALHEPRTILATYLTDRDLAIRQQARGRCP